MTPVLKAKEKPRRETVVTTFRAPRALVEEIDTEAKRTGISRNEAILQLLRFGLEAHRKPRK